MIEAGGDEIPEDVMIGAIEYGFEKCSRNSCIPRRGNG